MNKKNLFYTLKNITRNKNHVRLSNETIARSVRHLNVSRTFFLSSENTSLDYSSCTRIHKPYEPFILQQLTDINVTLSNLMYIVDKIRNMQEDKFIVTGWIDKNY